MEKIARQAKNQGVYLFHKYGLILLTVGITLFFGIIQKNFFTLRNLLNILSSACLTSIAGIGVTCIMSSGEMDYGAGTHLTMGAVLMVVFLTKLHVNYFVAILMTLGCLALIGLLNAFLHIKGRMPAFIATMGTSFVFTGVAKMLTDGTDLLGVAEVTTPIFTFIGQGYLWGIIPMPLVVLVVVGALMVLFTEHTRSGKYLYAVGSNPEACKYIGINANVQKIKGFVLCSTLCGLAGIVQGSMINGALATLGSSMMLYAMIVPVSYTHLAGVAARRLTGARAAWRQRSRARPQSYIFRATAFCMASQLRQISSRSGSSKPVSRRRATRARAS